MQISRYSRYLNEVIFKQSDFPGRPPAHPPARPAAHLKWIEGPWTYIFISLSASSSAWLWLEAACFHSCGAYFAEATYSQSCCSVTRFPFSCQARFPILGLPLQRNGHFWSQLGPPFGGHLGGHLGPHLGVDLGVDLGSRGPKNLGKTNVFLTLFVNNHTQNL